MNVEQRDILGRLKSHTGSVQNGPRLIPREYQSYSMNLWITGCGLAESVCDGRRGSRMEWQPDTG